MSVVYPAPSPSFPTSRARPPSAATAETLVLVALILQVIGAAIVVGILAYVLARAAYHPFAFAWLIGVVALIIGAVAVVFLYLAYEYSYKRIQAGDYSGAQGPTLVIGILSIFLGLIPGILYLIGYAKLGDALREQQSIQMGYGVGYGWPGGPPPALAACRGCGRVYPLGQFPFCPNCGQKMGL